MNKTKTALYILSSTLLLFFAWPPSTLNYLTFIAFVPIIYLCFKENKAINSLLYFLLSISSNWKLWTVHRRIQLKFINNWSFFYTFFMVNSNFYKSISKEKTWFSFSYYNLSNTIYYTRTISISLGLIIFMV